MSTNESSVTKADRMAQGLQIVDQILINPPPHVRVINTDVDALPAKWVIIGPNRAQICREMPQEYFYCGKNILNIYGIDPDIEEASVVVETNQPHAEVVSTNLGPCEQHLNGRRVLRIFIVARQADSARIRGQLTSHYAVCKLRVSYTTTGANWHPKYELELDTVTGASALKLCAYTMNSTGETWSNCCATFSTSSLAAREAKARGMTAPSLTPWNMELRECNSRPKRNEEPGTRTHHERFKSQGTLPEQKIIANVGETSIYVSSKEWSRRQQEFNETLKAGHDIEWTMSEVCTVASTPRGPLRQVIGTLRPNDIGWEYTVVPKVDRRAYMRISFTNETKIGLMAAQVHVTVNGKPKARTALPRTMAGDKVNIDVGPCSSIAVKYNIISECNSYGKQSGEGQNFENVVRNCLIENTQPQITRPTRITVIDQVPSCSDPRFKLIPAFPPDLCPGQGPVKFRLRHTSKHKDWGTSYIQLDDKGEVRVYLTINPHVRAIQLPLCWHMSVPGGYRVHEKEDKE